MSEAWLKLKREFSVARVVFGGVFGFLLMGSASCQTQGIPLKSFCYLDFGAQTCWTSKTKSVGFSFAQMQAQQAQCDQGNTNVPCWLAIDSSDAQRIANKLNQCANPEAKSAKRKQK